LAKKSSARLADYQYAGVARGQPEKKPARRDRFDLRRFDPAAKPFSSGDKAADKAAVEALAAEIDKLQDVLWADRRFKLLVVLQGTDTSGKDGTIRGVFGLTSALGVRAVGWKAPTDVERAHDYLWRIHQQVPGRRRDRDLQPQPLRGRPRSRRPRLDHEGGDRAAVRAAQRLRAHAHRDWNGDPQVLPPRLEGRAAASGCRRASTTRPSTGSSRSPISTSASAGTTTRRRTAR
jgi:hypothetical protein